jgi:hypothetical protein
LYLQELLLAGVDAYFESLGLSWISEWKFDCQINIFILRYDFLRERLKLRITGGTSSKPNIPDLLGVGRGIMRKSTKDALLQSGTAC